MTNEALSGIERAQRQLEDSARRLNQPDPDHAREAVEQITAVHATKANVSVVKTADELIGTLLDILG